MPSVRDNATRIKRFRELKATLRTNRQRLLVGLDIAQAEHVVHMRHAHTRVVVPTLTIPNTSREMGDVARLSRLFSCSPEEIGSPQTPLRQEAGPPGDARPHDGR